MVRKIIISGLLISLVFSGGCATTAKKNTAAAPKKTIKSVMSGQHHQSKNTSNPVEQYRALANRWQQAPQHIRRTSHSDYTRSEARELEGLFPRLPNPDLCMYVYPHLSMEGATIPGYTSCFSLYDKNHYALPGEMMAPWQTHR